MSISYICATCRLRTAVLKGTRTVVQQVEHLSQTAKSRQDVQGDQHDQRRPRQARHGNSQLWPELLQEGRTASPNIPPGQLRGRYSGRILDPQQLLTELDSSQTIQRDQGQPRQANTPQKYRRSNVEQTGASFERRNASSTALRSSEKSAVDRDELRDEPREGTADQQNDAPSVLEPPHANPEEVITNRKPATDLVRFTETAIKRLGRALERHDVKAAERTYQDALDYSSQLPHGRLTMNLYEHLLLTFLSLRSPKKATEVWNEMMKAGIQPRSKTYTVMMRGSQSVNDIDAMEGFWNKMRRSNIQPDVHAWGTRMFGLLRSRSHVDVGLRALGEMGREWASAAKAAYAQQNPPKSKKTPVVEVAFADLVTRFPSDVDEVPRPNQITMNSAISALASSKDTYIPKVLSWGRSYGLEPDLTSYNVLINVSMRHGSLEDAMSMLQRMQARGIEANHTTWTVLLNAMFHGGMLDNLGSKEQETRVLALVNSMSNIDEKGYALVIDRLLKLYDNPTAAQAVLEHMSSQGVRPSAHIYTILMAYYFQQEQPSIAAVKSLWRHIQSSNSGFGSVLDSQFYDRMLEGCAVHHATMGTALMLQFLSSMEAEGKKPSWQALLCVARALWESNQLERLGQLVHRVRSRMSEGEIGNTGRRGQKDFWDFIVKTGSLGDEEISTAEQIMEIHQYGREHVHS